MKKIPVTGCHECPYHNNGTNGSWHCKYPNSKSIFVSKYVKSKTFHPDCKLEDDDWQELIEAQGEYIDLLTLEVSDMANLLSVHSYWEADKERVKEGKELRDKIKQLSR